jgi:zona occludens toxin (predicted ATPase)
MHTKGPWESTLAKLESVIPDIRTKASVVDDRLVIALDEKYRLVYTMDIVQDQKFDLAEQARRDIEDLERKKKLVGER